MMLAPRLAGRAVVSVPNPGRLSVQTEPRPDISLLRPESLDRAAVPEPGDVLLVVEVADTSISFDRGVKLRHYAEAGVPEVWIVNLRAGLIEVYREPSGGEYWRVERFERGARLAPSAFPDVVLAVDEILGPRSGR